jgi:very-short-patch-repair endonuclease
MAYHAGAPDTAPPHPPAPYPEPPGVGGSDYRTVPVLGAVSGATVSGTAHERIAAIAALQRGYVSRGQLLAAGVSSTTVDRYVTGKWLLPVHRGVFAVGHNAPVELGPETAALLAVRAGAALSHDTAAILWGMKRHAEGERLIHVTVPGSPGGRPENVCVHRSTALTARDLRVRDGLPVTSPARVLLDLAPSATPRDLERMLDQGIVQHALRLSDVTELLRRCGRHRGRARLQALVDHHTTTTFTRSEAEELFLALVRQAQLPQPLTNVRRHGYEIDFLWPAEGVAVEVDGFAFHRTRGRFERDHRKDAVLESAGIGVTRITWGQMRDEPLAVIARLAPRLSPARTRGR